MKKKFLILLAVMAFLACALALSASAEDRIIKLDYAPTLEEIHANPEAYISHLDYFDGNAYGELDSYSVVVLSDLAETPTYYVYPSYYYIQSTTNSVRSQLPTLNAAISAADPSAFAGYVTIDGNFFAGSCKYLIRYEVPTYVTALETRAKFESSSNLLEVYFPTKTVIDEETGLEKTVTYITSVSGQNLFSACTKLEYIHNMEYLPIGIVQGNADGFTSCNALKEIKIPYGVTSIPSNCFKNCWAVTEVVLPNTVTTMGKGAFASCYALESFTFSANFNTFVSVNLDYETFSNCNKLKFIYMPATVLGTMEAKANNYRYIFGVSSKVVYFVTGTEDDAIYIRDWFETTKANDNIANADMVAYDQSVDYAAYQSTLTNSLIVYGYSPCEAFYNGEHNVAAEYSLSYTGEELLSTAIISRACLNCDYYVDATYLNPLVICLGYSTNGKGSIVQGFKVDKSILPTYESYLGTITFGVVFALDSREDKSTGADILSECRCTSREVNVSVTNHFAIGVSAIPEKSYDRSFFLCAYASFDDRALYINNGVSDTVATSTTYNAQK